MMHQDSYCRRRADQVTFMKKLLDPQNVYAILLVLAAAFFVAVNVYSIPKIATACDQNSRDILRTSAELAEMRASYTANMERIFAALNRIETKVDRHMEKGSDK
jgi:hypothetical protein